MCGSSSPQPRSSPRVSSSASSSRPGRTRRSRPEQCDQAPKAIVVPGVPTTQAAVVRRDLAQEDVAAFEILARDHPKDAVVQFNYATLLFCRGYIADATSAFEQAKKVGAEHLLRGGGGQPAPPAVLPPERRPGLSDLRAGTARSAPRARHHPAARAAPALGRGDLPAGREAASERRPGSGRGGRRALQRGRHLRRVLAPRAAASRASRTARPCATTSGCCSRGRASAPRRFASSRSPFQLGPKTTMGREAAEFLQGPQGRRR